MIDVLIVGAGPAGNNAALELAGRGFSVSVIDRRQVIGDKLCTGIVGAECLRQFPADPSIIYRSGRSATVYSPSGETLRVERAEAQAYIVNRVAYVASFAEKAKKAGAEYLLGHEVRSLTVEAGSVTALIANGTGPHPVTAKAAIIAGGFGSRLTRMAGLGQVGDYLIGAQVEVEAAGLSEVEVYLGRTVAPGSFAWLVPTKEGRALLGLIARRKTGQLLETLIARLTQDGKIGTVTSPAKRWGIPIRPLKQAYRDRLLVIGDAAGQVKPATGGGIYYGLQTSALAAETLATALSGGNLSANALAPYERAWRALLGEELDTAYGARRIFEMLGDRQIDYLVRMMSSNGLASRIFDRPDSSFDWHGGIARQVLRLPGVQGTIRLVSAVGRLASQPA